ncbi:hypothetical protein CEP54_005848 [Fusarium duplospermum]|uniref:Uncharacterized protein n=1 Tax=Fusarium duplospermum TaxID=1325734 RepID=A0A428QAF7_9HYPO|nr:hypothetical protein CEP54_005848 [Fusarium duplospermum]
MGRLPLVAVTSSLSVIVYQLNMFSGDLAYIRPLKMPKRRTIITVEMTDFSDKQRKREEGCKTVQDNDQNISASRVIRQDQRSDVVSCC